MLLTSCGTARAESTDLAAMYPNLNAYATQYLTGHNYLPGPNPAPAVLWFENVDGTTFRQHNWGPPEPCHSDYLSWWSDGYLRYVKTVDACPGTNPATTIDYGTTGSPIIYLPRVWDGGAWSRSGSSPAVYSLGTATACTGTNAWTATILGWEDMAPGERGLHFRSVQTTSWVTGAVPGGCAAGYATHWQEDYWLVADLPGPAGPTPGLKRTKGGNLDNGAGSWDIWFDRWTPLP